MRLTSQSLKDALTPQALTHGVVECRVRIVRRLVQKRAGTDALTCTAGGNTSRSPSAAAASQESHRVSSSGVRAGDYPGYLPSM